MKITINGSAEEIATLVLQLQQRQIQWITRQVELDSEQVSEATERYMRDICAKSQSLSES